jgi:hypothetical protein
MHWFFGRWWATGQGQSVPAVPRCVGDGCPPVMAPSNHTEAKKQNAKVKWLG